MAGNLVLLAIVFFACSPSSDNRGQGTALVPRDSLPVMTGDSVTTLISDSGITRYRIEAPQWQVFDKKEPSCQVFPDGIYLEQFDENLTVKASLKADYAFYNEPEQHWTLRGNVHAMNRKGEQFDTYELKWDQRLHRVYSDTAIHITREKSIIEGLGFESNEEMSKYTIMHPTGVFPIDEEQEPMETDDNPAPESRPSKLKQAEL